MVVSLLMHAEIVKGFRVVFELFLFLGLLDGHVFAFPVERDWELRIKVVVLGDHQQGSPSILSWVYHCIFWLLLNISLFFLVHPDPFSLMKYFVMIISKDNRKIYL